MDLHCFFRFKARLRSEATCLHFAKGTEAFCVCLRPPRHFVDRIRFGHDVHTSEVCCSACDGFAIMWHGCVVSGVAFLVFSVHAFVVCLCHKVTMLVEELRSAFGYALSCRSQCAG